MTRIRTPLTELIGIEHPVVQTGMGWVAGARLVSATSNAGGLGSLPCAIIGADQIRSELRAIGSSTSRPYNVNFFVHKEPTPDPSREEEWRKVLAPYFAEQGIEPAAIQGGPQRLPFNDAAADVLEEFKPPVVSFHFGLPSDSLMKRVKSWGSKVLSSATTLDEAQYLEAHGVDAIIAQGSEAGGHRGMFLSADLNTQVPTTTLVRQLVGTVNIPVIAAGGIADARCVAAAMVLGAAGVQIGTAYLLCPEATTSAVHRAALKSEAARHTALTNLFTGRPARGIVNRFMRELGPIREAVPAFPLAVGAVMPLRARAESQGSGDFSPLWSGQNASGCKEIPAAQLTRELAARLH